MKEKIKNMLIKADLKFTQTRYSLLDILLKSKSPQNYNQIKSKLSMDKATFYRNMIIFEEKGLVNKFESKERIWHYEIGKSEHAHFICEICQTIICLDKKIPFTQDEYQVTNMILKGKCKSCLY